MNDRLAPGQTPIFDRLELEQLAPLDFTPGLPCDADNCPHPAAWRMRVLHEHHPCVALICDEHAGDVTHAKRRVCGHCKTAVTVELTPLRGAR